MFKLTLLHPGAAGGLIAGFCRDLLYRWLVLHPFSPAVCNLRLMIHSAEGVLLRSTHLSLLLLMLHISLSPRYALLPPCLLYGYNHHLLCEMEKKY